MKVDTLPPPKRVPSQSFLILNNFVFPPGSFLKRRKYPFSPQSSEMSSPPFFFCHPNPFGMREHSPFQQTLERRVAPSLSVFFSACFPRFPHLELAAPVKRRPRTFPLSPLAKILLGVPPPLPRSWADAFFLFNTPPFKYMFTRCGPSHPSNSMK